MSAAAKTEPNRAIIGLGSNIEPEENLPAAVQALASKAKLVALSSAWQTPAVGGGGPDFLNAAAELHTQLDAAALKAQVLAPIEASLGRRREQDPNAPRTIDLDILIFNDVVLDQDIWRFAHLAVPLAEIGLEAREPGSNRPLQEIAAKFKSRGDIQRLDGGLGFN